MAVIMTRVTLTLPCVEGLQHFCEANQSFYLFLLFQCVHSDLLHWVRTMESSNFMAFQPLLFSRTILFICQGSLLLSILYFLSSHLFQDFQGRKKPRKGEGVGS